MSRNANLAAQQHLADHLNAGDVDTAGTHEGDFQGVAPTGRRIEARGVQIARFADGEIVERWGSSDELGIMRQIGAEERIVVTG